MEPIDWLFSTGVAVQSLFASDQDVVAGPVGYVASLTPFWTLVPALELPPPTTLKLDGRQRVALYDEDPARRVAAIAAAANDPRLVAVSRESAGPETLACTLVLLRTATSAPTLDEAARKAAFAGHFANMGRLAREGELLIAGPYGQDKHAADLRGLFVLDTGDEARARELAGSDPAVQAGIFRLEFVSFSTAAPLRRYLARELGKLDAAAAAGKQPAPGEGGRTYVWATVAVDAERVAGVLLDPRVLIGGQLADGSWLLLLDALDVAAGKAITADLGLPVDDVVFDHWFGSGLLAGLR
ncbi:MAG: hypothetical protein IPK26_20245 [Planctomycetes bacterium]|nr:hypothetical protein [Planctomycetota bacterium]